MDKGTICLRTHLPSTFLIYIWSPFRAALDWCNVGLRTDTVYQMTSCLRLRALCVTNRLFSGIFWGSSLASRTTHRSFCSRSLNNSRQYDRFLWWLSWFDFFVRQELCLHLVSVNIRQVMEDILSEVTGHLFCASKAAHQLLGFVQAVIATQCLPLTFCVLLQEQRWGSYFIDCLAPTDADRHTALLAVEHEALHLLLVVLLAANRWRLSLRMEVRCLAFSL